MDLNKSVDSFSAAHQSVLNQSQYSKYSRPTQGGERIRIHSMNGTNRQNKFNLNFNSPRTIRAMEELGLTEKYFRKVNLEMKQLHSQNMDPNIKRLHVDHHKKRMETGFKKVAERRQKYINAENIKNQLQKKYEKDKYFDTKLEHEHEQEKEKEKEYTLNKELQKKSQKITKSQNLTSQTNKENKAEEIQDLNQKSDKNLLINLNLNGLQTKSEESDQNLNFNFQVQNEYKNPIFQLDRLEERNRRQLQAKIKQAQIALGQEDRKQQIEVKDLERPIKTMINKYEYELKQEKEREEKRRILERKQDLMKDEDERKQQRKQKNYQEYLDYIKYRSDIDGRFYKQEYENQKIKKIQLKQYLAVNQQNSKIRKQNIDFIDSIHQDLILVKDELFKYSKILQHRNKNQRILIVQEIENTRNYDLSSNQKTNEESISQSQQQHQKSHQSNQIQNNSANQQDPQNGKAHTNQTNIYQSQNQNQNQNLNLNQINQNVSQICRKFGHNLSQSAKEERFWVYMGKIKEELVGYQQDLLSGEIQQVSRSYAKRESAELLLKQLLSILARSEDYYRKQNLNNQQNGQNNLNNQNLNGNTYNNQNNFGNANLNGKAKNLSYGKLRSVSLNNFGSGKKRAQLNINNNINNSINNRFVQNLNNKNINYSAGKVLGTDISSMMENMDISDFNQMKLDLAKEKAEMLNENKYNKVLNDYIEKEKRAKEKMENKIRKEVEALNKKIEQNEVLSDKKYENEQIRHKQLQEEMERKNDKEIIRLEYQEKKRQQQEYQSQLQKEKLFLRRLEQQEAEELRLREQKIKQTQLSEKMKTVQNNIMDKTQKQQMLQKARINYTMSLHDQRKNLDNDIQQYSKTIAKSNFQGDLKSYKKLAETGTRIHNKIMSDTMDPTLLLLHNTVNVNPFITAAQDNTIKSNNQL